MAKKNNNNKLIYGLIGGALVLIVFLMIGKKNGWIGERERMQVTMGEAKKVDITEQVSASGMIQPIVEVKISPEVSAEIIELNVEEGDSVAVGDVLIKLKPDNLKSALDRTRASLNQQRANLADAEARLASAQASFNRSELEYNRQKKLHDSKAISNADMELAEANFKIAAQDLKSAEKGVEASKYIVQSAMASVKEANENLMFTTITAPMGGIVSKLGVEKGERVVGTSQMAGTEMMRIADLGHMEVRVDVNENDIVRVSVGNEVEIDVDAYSYLDKKFKGRVTAIANTANEKASPDAVTEFEVKIRILNSSYQDLVANNKVPFRPGMTASVDIVTNTKRGILSVPLGAVTTRVPKVEEEESADDKASKRNREEDLKEVVFVNEDGVAKLRVVKTGISDFDNIEILEGLTESDQVITGPYLAVSKKLEDGELVKGQEDKEEKKKD
ncbi:efflux RND transporter periplasmic adaptor subunit [Reichenbachiella carrageenanivorans]|uniref:Efflux RND transporter periplasmic adaptor subunit n=1 Tax=Reichenbachiella carrageenanivorans TaxID=2979869 RepID=A0ABY6CYG5_9BACT|nr:efflux RND transporter periplasmic adaptor subunit [Reichenbachiella carrageenanivorans]UXX78952.1 efflux RND transporter periplasmic adaptor subunit [Reichenbachiella carrageenanivorans]